MSHSLPIDPSLDAGKLRVLVPLIGEASAAPVPLGELDGQWDFDMDFRSASTNNYAKLGVSAVFAGEATLNSTTVVWDALVGKRAVLENPSSSSVIYETFWGVGLRIGLTFRQADVSTDVSVGMLAANAEFKAIDVQYEIHAIGLGPKELARVLRIIPPLGRFDITAYALLEDVRKALRGALFMSLKNGATSRDALRPAIVKLSLSPFQDDVNEAATYRFTMQNIEAGLTLAESLARLSQWKNVKSDDVSKLFTSTVGGTGKPSDKVRADARAWLRIDG